MTSRAWNPRSKPHDSKSCDQPLSLGAHDLVESTTEGHGDLTVTSSLYQVAQIAYLNALETYLKPFKRVSSAFKSSCVLLMPQPRDVHGSWSSVGLRIV